MVSRMVESEPVVRHPVRLVGAGPGDPELLTLKAVRAIGWADVLLVDELVNPAVLSHARPEARIRHVGKRGGLRSTPQRFIDWLMVREALAGRRVVRLKGGDPLMFGRAGEEIAWLHRHGIEVDIVNGVSSAFAASAALGTSLTHREHSHGVVFLTGHPGAREAAVDPALLARAGLTLVFFMGLSRAAGIRARLLAGGLPADTPVGVVHAASTAAERTIVTSLDRFDVALEEAGIGSPALIVVGEVSRGCAAIHAAPGEREWSAAQAVSSGGGSPASTTWLRPRALAR